MRSYLVFRTSALPIMVVPRLHNVPIAHLGCSPSPQCPHCLSWLFPIFTMFWLPILVALYLHNVPIANRRCSLSSRCPHCPSKLFSVFIMSPLPIVVVPYLHDVPVPRLHDVHVPIAHRGCSRYCRCGCQQFVLNRCSDHFILLPLEQFGAWFTTIIILKYWASVVEKYWTRFTIPAHLCVVPHSICSTGKFERSCHHDFFQTIWSGGGGGGFQDYMLGHVTLAVILD